MHHMQGSNSAELFLVPLDTQSCDAYVLVPSVPRGILMNRTPLMQLSHLK